MTKKINEDAPANSAGAGGVSGISIQPEGKPANWGEPGVSKSNQKKKKHILRRKSPLMEEVPMGMFAGNQTFIVPQAVFLKVKTAKQDKKHWRKFIDEDGDVLSPAVREFVNKHPKAPVIFQDEISGYMCYVRYGKELYYK